MTHEPIDEAGQITRALFAYRCEKSLQMLVIDRAAIVGVDQGEIPDFGSLVKVRHAGRCDLEKRLRERVAEPGARDGLLKLYEVGEERIALARLKYLRDDRAHRRIIRL